MIHRCFPKVREPQKLPEQKAQVLFIEHHPAHLVMEITYIEGLASHSRGNEMDSCIWMLSTKENRTTIYQQYQIKRPANCHILSPALLVLPSLFPSP